jgi:uncharacterized membrane protein
VSSIVGVLKESTKSSISKKLYALILLNALDGILTYISLYYGYAIELNPIAKGFVENLGLVLFIKISIPSILLWVAANAMMVLQLRRPLFVNRFVNFGVLVYTFILFNHLYILLRVFHYLVVMA